MTDRNYYIVECDCLIKGRRIRVIEDSAEVFTERQCVAFVSRLENVRRIIEVNAEDRVASAVTADIAAKVLALESDEGHLVSQDFLEEHLGCEAVAEALREIGQ